MGGSDTEDRKRLEANGSKGHASDAPHRYHTSYHHTFYLTTEQINIWNDTVYEICRVMIFGSSGSMRKLIVLANLIVFTILNSREVIRIEYSLITKY